MQCLCQARNGSIERVDHGTAQPGSARFAVEGGRVLPEPGHEDAWIAEMRG
jgi:hypothetical protein